MAFLALGFTLIGAPLLWLTGQQRKDIWAEILVGYWLGVAGLLLVLLVAHHNRQRILVRGFQQHLGEISRVSGPALASLLRHELASITSVFRTIDEAAPGQAHRSLRLELEVEDIGAELEKTEGDDLAVSTPFGRFSVAKLWRALGLFRGPTLTGDLHREGCGLVLTVDLTGGGKRGSWKVVEADLSESERTSTEATKDCDPHEEAKAFALVRQAAYRIAAQLASLGSPRWEAVRAFTEGLRAYRKVSRSDIDRDIELRRAERLFIEALHHDQGFARGHYNLGVVYSQLEEFDAALAAFRQSIETDPDRFDPYLGLGTAYFDKGLAILDLGGSRGAARECFLQAAVYAGKAIRISPLEPRPWNGLATAWTLLLWQGDKPRGPETTPQRQLADLVSAYTTATALAWRQMCRAELSVAKNPSPEEAKAVAVLCLENLAEVLYEQDTPLHREAELQRAAALLTTALKLAPRKPSLRVALGKALASQSRHNNRFLHARRELYEAFGDGLDQVTGAARWAWLLALDAHRHEQLRSQQGASLQSELRTCREGMRRAFSITLDLLVPPENLLLRRLSRDLEHFDVRVDTELARYRGFLRRVEREIRQIVALPWCEPGSEPGQWMITLEVAVAELQRIERLEGSADRRSRVAPRRELAPWVRAQELILEARRELIERPERAIPLLYKVIRSLSRFHARQLKRQALDALLARAYLALGDRLPKVESWKADRYRWRRRFTPPLPAHRGECLQRALDHAFRAVALEPERAPRRLVLSQVHAALGDFDQAEAERHSALGLGPSFALLSEHRVLPELARRWLGLLALAKDDEERRELQQRAARDLTHFCELLEASPFPPVYPNASQPRPLFFDDHADVHLALGRLVFATEPRQAIDHLWIAHQSHPNDQEATQLLKRALADPAVVSSVREVVVRSSAREVLGWVELMPPAAA